MNIETFTPSALTHFQLRAVGSLARSGFGDSPNIEQDTENHIEASEVIQLATYGEVPVAFAMYRGCLWQ